MPNNNTYDQTDTRVNGTTEKEFDELGKELTEEKFKAIYQCAHEWCEKQYTTNGLANYFKAYYTGNSLNK